MNVDALIQHFGGISEMSRRCTAKGYSITKQGVSRWRSAGTVPMTAWIALCEIEAKDGKVTLDLRKYLVWE